MKALIPLVLLSLVACGKKEKEVVYTATCDRCYVWFQTTERELSAVAVDGYWNVFAVDTLFTPEDTVIVLDSTRVLGTWTATTTLLEDTKPSIKARNEYGSTVTTIGLNGETITAKGYMEVVTLH